MDTKTKQKLRKFINKLSLIRGRHTELVSVYIPQDYDLNKIINHISQEQGTASNIKDKATRTNVIDSLERMIRHLRLYKRTPENGLAVFAGNISDKDSKTTIEVFALEPPEPVKVRIYRCDQTFLLDPLINMIEYKDVYGLVVMDRREATIGFLQGTSIKAAVHQTSGVPGKIKAGGQCIFSKTLIKINKKTSFPISKLKIGAKVLTYDFQKNKLKYTKLLDKWKKEKNKLYIIKTKHAEIKCSKDHLLFIKKNNKILEIPAEKISIGDTLFYINKNLKNKEVKVTNIKIKKEKINLIDISVKNHNFIANGLIVHNSAQRFHRITEGLAKEFYKRIAAACNKEFLGKKELKGIIVGGPGPTKEDFLLVLNQELKNKIIAVQDITYTNEQGLHDLVDKSRDVLAKEIITKEKEILIKFFTMLAKEQEKTTYGQKETEKALELGAVDTLLISEDIDDHLIEKLELEAEKTSSHIEILSSETREGVQLRDLGGIAAILRFPIS